ncbi:MAG: sulfite exporter TauE/SafE family protein [Candidatus Omnitrophica bacterium]|nr:sulfite exporter TauE/SafE family protein [Candidatus Omnitrophota bacterium]
MMHYILLLMLGVAGGIIGGVFGVGGGIIIVPVLILGFGLTQHMAQGTMLATLLLPSFVFAVWTYHKAGNINWPIALLVSLGMMFGAILGAMYAQALPAPTLRGAFGALLVVIGLKLIFGK